MTVQLDLHFSGPVHFRTAAEAEQILSAGAKRAARKLLRSLDGLDEVVGG